jgi:hypothetical protein
MLRLSSSNWLMAISSFHGVIAIELNQHPAPVALFDRSSSQSLAEALRAEIRRHLGDLDAIGVCWMAGIFDSAQLLRPGFPLFGALTDIYRAGVKDPIGTPQLVTLNSLHGKAPTASLEPDRSLLGGQMVFVPFVLVAQDFVIKTVSEQLEACLGEQGLVDARFALKLASATGVNVEHARLMTINDLAAMTTLQLDHAGFQAFGQILEAALFFPSSRQTRAISNTGIELSFAAQNLQIQTHDLSLFAARCLPNSDQSTRLDRFIEHQIELRQILALANAHALRVTISVGGDEKQVDRSNDFWIQSIQTCDFSQIKFVVACTTPAIGTLVWVCLDGTLNECAVVYPLTAHALKSLRQRFLSAGSAPQWSEVPAAIDKVEKIYRFVTSGFTSISR